MHQNIDDTLIGDVDAALRDYLSSRLAETAELTAEFHHAATALTDFVLGGGKRLRPTFAWWGWRAAGGAGAGEQAGHVVHAISALELIQACALIHDDLMDASATRRGAPTVHIAFADRHRAAGWHGEPARFGEAAALLLGDLALAWADDMFTAAALPAEALAAGEVAWRRMRQQMLAGQYLDVVNQARADQTADPEQAALRIAALKTAAYTVAGPLRLGAALAGADEPTEAALRAFGTDLGVAFQLRDDLLGVFGDEQVTGKPAGDDLREGKRTLLIALGLARATDVQAKTLRDALGRPDLDAATIDEVRTLLVDLGAVAAVEQRITTLTASATDALAGADIAEPAATRLTELAVAATRRDR